MHYLGMPPQLWVNSLGITLEEIGCYNLELLFQTQKNLIYSCKCGTCVQKIVAVVGFVASITVSIENMIQ